MDELSWGFQDGGFREVALPENPKYRLHRDLPQPQGNAPGEKNMLKLNVTEKVLVESDLAPTNSREVLQYVTPIEQIETLALEAFQNQGGDAWQKIQFLNYSIKRDTGEPGSGGVQGTKRVHWRRGFLRNQPYGQGRQQRKLVWIEPVLVMGGS